mgnify:CR=1 FL=1
MTSHPTTGLLRDMRAHSLAVLTQSQHRSGAFPAALGYPVYNYCWFRDGAFVAEALSQVGESDSATRFHQWCRQVIDDRTVGIRDLVQRSADGEKIAGSEMLPTRYTLDGKEGTEDWWDYQLDGYGTWLWALVQHLNRHDLDPAPYLPAVETTVSYLCAFGDQPCFDWWEEFEQHRHVSTLASVVAGLRAAETILSGEVAVDAAQAARRLQSLIVECGHEAGHLPKWIGSTAVDASLLSVMVPYGVIEPGTRIGEATYRKILSDLVADGVYRYRGDTFYGGGEWINLTAWLGLYEATTGRIGQAKNRRDWILAQAKPNGDLPEQVATNAQAPERIAEWEQRWGTVATPLLWSHAMFLTLDHILEQREDET